MRNGSGCWINELGSKMEKGEKMVGRERREIENK